MSTDSPDKLGAEEEAKSETKTESQTSKKPRSKKGKKPAKKSSKKGRTRTIAGRVGTPRPFPAETLEEALKVPTVIKEYNGGNPWPPSEVARALDNLGPRGDKFYYLTASSRDYGFTSGNRDSDQIALDTVGRTLLYATSPEVERQAIRDAFFNVEVFRAVYEYYRGASLPDLKYLQNTLESVFHIAPQYHQDFVRIFTDNCKFLEGYGITTGILRETGVGGEPPRPHSVVVGEPESKTPPVAFVIMPFVEKTDQYPVGFFEEVLRNVITPAAIAAEFKVETAKREGSDVIHSTIVNELLAADLVIADLTEHNPNVLFELGLSMAFEKPIALIRARGTGAIFDVDNLLRVLDYDPNLWKSTIEIDVPRLTSHIRGAWDGRSTAMTYMQILKKRE